MSINLFQHQYSFQKNEMGLIAENETTHAFFTIPIETVQLYFSHLQQMAEISRLSHTSEEIDRCITNLTNLQKIDVLAHPAKTAKLLFQGMKTRLPTEGERIDYLVTSLYRFLPTSFEDEIGFRKDTVKELAEFKKPPIEEVSEEINELQTVLDRYVEPVHAAEWKFLKTLIHETAKAQSVDEILLKEKILERLKNENEDLLYLLHITIGGLLSQESVPLGIGEIKKVLQKNYEQWVKEASLRVSELFQARKSFEEVLQFVQLGRQTIALTCYHFPPDPFGRRRRTPLYTPIEEKYLSWLPKIVRLATEHYHPVRGFEDLGELETEYLKTKTISFQIHGKERPLTSFIVSTKHQTGAPYREIMYSDNPGNEAPDYVRAVICHTPSQAYDLVIKHLNSLIRAYFEKKDFPIERAGEIHWFFAHLCPLDRGSAAVGEILIKGLLKAKGIEIEWNLENPPDLFLLTTPNREEVYHSYRNCFTQLKLSQ